MLASLISSVGGDLIQKSSLLISISLDTSQPRPSFLCGGGGWVHAVTYFFIFVHKNFSPGWLVTLVEEILRVSNPISLYQQVRLWATAYPTVWNLFICSCEMIFWFIQTFQVWPNLVNPSAVAPRNANFCHDSYLQYNTLGRWVDCLIDQASDSPSIIW